MRSLHTAACALTLLALGGCAGGVTEIGSVDYTEVDTKYEVISWTTGSSNTYYYAVVERDGFTAVCGAWSESGARQQVPAFQFLAAMAVDAAGDRLVQGLNYFLATGRAEPGEINGTTLACGKTDRPWSEAYAATPPELVLTQRRFRL